MSSVPDPKVFVNYRCMLFEAILANNIHIYAVICSTKFLVKKTRKATRSCRTRKRAVHIYSPAVATIDAERVARRRCCGVGL